MKDTKYRLVGYIIYHTLNFTIRSPNGEERACKQTMQHYNRKIYQTKEIALDAINSMKASLAYGKNDTFDIIPIYVNTDTTI